jgi:hypothetical protein
MAGNKGHELGRTESKRRLFMKGREFSVGSVVCSTGFITNCD